MSTHLCVSMVHDVVPVLGESHTLRVCGCQGRVNLTSRTMKSVMDSRGACTSLEMGGAFSKETVSMATL